MDTPAPLNRKSPSKSRYEAEFEEIGFIGAGGFGSVAKCRLRRHALQPDHNEDEADLYFAVKRISLPSSNDPESDAFVLREASNLASLHHEYIVRYFSAWLEEGRPRPPTSGLSSGDLLNSSRRVPPPLVPKTSTPFYFSTRGGLSSARVSSRNLHSPGRSIPESSEGSESIGVLHAQPALAAFLRQELLASCSEAVSSSSGSTSSQDSSFSSEQIHLSSPQGTPIVSSGADDEGQEGDPAADGRRGAQGGQSKSMKPQFCLGLNHERGRPRESSRRDRRDRRSSSPSSESSVPRPVATHPAQRPVLQKDMSPSSLSESSQEVMFLRGTGDPVEPSSEDRVRTPVAGAMTNVHRGNRPPTLATPASSAMQVKRYLYIAMEYVDGMTLRQAINQSSFKGDIVRVWESFRQICEGVAFIHEHHFVHRDLKPENVFLKMLRDPNQKGDFTSRRQLWTVKIGDFGLSTFIERQPHAMPRVSVASASQPRPSKDMACQTVGVGTQFYIAPEVERSDGGYDQAADLFAMGVILFEMLVPPPKTVMERHVTLTRLLESQGKSAPEQGVTDKVAARLIASLLSREPSERLSAPQLLRSIPVQTVSKAEKTLANLLAHPYSHEMLRLLNSLFARCETDQRCRTFWEKYKVPPLASSAVVTEVKSFINSLCRTLNAVQVDLPIVMPPPYRSLPMATEPFQMLTPTGEVLELPHCLLRSMQATLPTIQVASVIRRFAVEPVFRQPTKKLLQPSDPQRAQPSSSLRVVFDNVVNFGKLDAMERTLETHTLDRIQRESLFEIEPVRVLWSVVNTFTPWLGETELMYAYGAVVPLLLKVFMKVPEESAESLGAYVRSTTYDSQLFKQRLREIFTVEIATGKISADFTEYAKVIDEWRQYTGKATDWVVQQRRKTVLLPPDDQHVSALNDMLSHIECFEETLTVALGRLAMTRVLFTVTLDFDTVLFNSERGFVFLHYVVPRLKGGPASRVDQSNARNVMQFDCIRLKNQLPVIAIGGRYDVLQEDYSGQPSPAHANAGNRMLNASGVEIDIQRLVDATMTKSASHPKWKTRWRNHFMQQSTTHLRQNRSGSQPSIADGESLNLYQDEESTQTEFINNNTTSSHNNNRPASRSSRSNSRLQPTTDRPERKRSGKDDRKVAALPSNEDVAVGGGRGPSAPSQQQTTSAPDLVSSDVPGGTKLNNAFLLLPPCTPIDSVNWLEAVNNLHPTHNGVVAQELAKTLCNWRVAIETSYAPPILRRFNPMIMAGHATNQPSSHMVQIVYQNVKLIPYAFAVRSRLSGLQITSCVRPEAINDLGSAKRHTRQGAPFDWLVFVTSQGGRGGLHHRDRGGSHELNNVQTGDTEQLPPSAIFDSVSVESGNGLRYRLVPCHASKYIGSDETRRHHVQTEIEQADKWYDNTESVCASLLRFYLELLGAMSPSVGHLFTAQSDIAFATA